MEYKKRIILDDNVYFLLNNFIFVLFPNCQPTENVVYRNITILTLLLTYRR